MRLIFVLLTQEKEMPRELKNEYNEFDFLQNENLDKEVVEVSLAVANEAAEALMGLPGPALANPPVEELQKTDVPGAQCVKGSQDSESRSIFGILIRI